MQTRRDQLHAYRFLTKRALAALVTGEPNAVEPPMRRLTLTTISGVMIAVLVGVGFAVFGLIKPSAGDSWKDPSVVVIERETGAHYIYRDGKLDPVLNFSSAVLAVSTEGSTSQAKVVTVDRSDIADTPLGPTIGIDKIPESLPASSAIVNSPWIVCSRQHPESATTLRASVSVTVGSGVLHPASLPADAAVLVSTPTAPDTDYLLWQGQRFEIAPAAITALGINDPQPLVVGTAFLQSMDAGTKLDTPKIVGLGDTGSPIDGHATKVGQLLQSDTTQDYYVVLPDGVLPVTPIEAALLQTEDGPAPITVPGNALVSAPKSDLAGKALLDGSFHDLPDAGLPKVTTAARDVGNVCAVFTDNANQLPHFAVVASQLPAFDITTVNESPLSAGGTADTVTVSPGHAALVKSGDRSPTVFVIATPGKKYAFASPSLPTAFGYAGIKPAALPGQLLPLIPTGAALDPVAARTPASG